MRTMSNVLQFYLTESTRARLYQACFLRVNLMDILSYLPPGSATGSLAEGLPLSHYSNGTLQMIEYQPATLISPRMEDSTLVEDARTPTDLSVSSLESRLSIPFGFRFPSATTLAFITGVSLGLSHGSKMSGLRFRAENSHRFPTTSTGWYLYHKSKNYHMMLGGIKEGVKMGSKVAFWAGSFFLVEEAVDHLRGSKDFMSTLIAGLSISGGFSAWSEYLLSPKWKPIKLTLLGPC